MATPKDPNKTLLEEQALIDASQRRLDGEVATVHNGQTIATADGTVTLVVEGGAVSATYEPAV